MFNSGVLKQVLSSIEGLRSDFANYTTSMHGMMNGHNGGHHDVAHAQHGGHEAGGHHGFHLGDHTVPMYHFIVECFNILGVLVMVCSTLGVIPKLLFDIFPKILGLSSDAECSTKAHGKMLECRIQLSRGLILGMDLMVASDVIETLCGQVDLVRLVVIVAVRSWLGWERNQEMSHMSHEYESWQHTMAQGLAAHIGHVTMDNFEEKTRTAFDSFDKDGNGMIDASELKTAFSTVGVTVNDQAIAKMVGSKGGINYPEFVEVVKTLTMGKAAHGDHHASKEHKH